MLTKLFPYSILVGGFLLLSMNPPAKHVSEGGWLSTEGDSKIAIAPCGDKLCGTITWLKTPPANEKEGGVGTVILKDFTITDDHTLENGRVLDPKGKKWYKGRLKVGDDGKLELRAWLGMPALGKSVYWTRAK